MNFKETFNRVEQQEKYDPKIEIGSFAEVEGLIKYYALKKAVKNEWGNEQQEKASQEIKNKVDISDADLLAIFEKVQAAANQNEEVLKWLAFAYNKDENIKNSIIKEIVRHKDFIEDDAKKLMLDFFEMMDIFLRKNNFFNDLNLFINNDIKDRQEYLPKLQKKIQEAIDFFQAGENKIKKVVYLPTNPLEKSQSGSGIDTGEVFYVNSEKGNEVNEIHEFLHSIINPITEKINLSDEDDQAIFKFCPDKLKSYEYARSILTEEIIRTYKTGFTPDNKPGFDNFKKRLLSADKNKLEKELNLEKEKGENLANNVDELVNSDELIKRYYEKYGEDKLSERIWQFFEDYHKNGAENFENYLFNNYQKILYNNHEK